jgi:hypothetical protein
MVLKNEALDALRKAYREQDIALYLGAGISVGSGLPTWERLVLAMYFSALSKESLGGWRPFPNYLFAIAEWHLEHGHEPLEITARKIRRYYRDDDTFLRHLWETLYAGFVDSYDDNFADISGQAIRAANSTLNAVARLCEKKVNGKRCVKSVITYNYDSLLETSLSDCPFQPIFRSEPLNRGNLPIYHVHGYVPLKGNGSAAEDLVFTEEQYHFAAQDAYSWANLVQIQCMSGSTGLMIGLSLSDRNMRRLLDAVSRTPVETRNFALLQEPQWKEPDNAEIKQIDMKARQYFDRFTSSGIKARGGFEPGIKGGPTWQLQIIDIISEVRNVDVEQQTFILQQLGILPIWYKDHHEIPDILADIST